MGGNLSKRHVRCAGRHTQRGPLISNIIVESSRRIRRVRLIAGRTSSQHLWAALPVVQYRTCDVPMLELGRTETNTTKDRLLYSFLFSSRELY